MTAKPGESNYLLARPNSDPSDCLHTLNNNISGIKKLTKKDYLLILTLCLDTICLGMGYALLSSFYPVVAQTKGLTLFDIGIVYSCLPAASILFGFVVPPLLSKIGTRKLLLLSLWIGCLSFLPFAFVMSVPPGSPFYIASIACRIVQGIHWITNQIAVFSIVAGNYKDRLATIMGFIEMSLTGGMSLGPAAGGFLYDISGFQAPFFSLCSMNVLFFVATLFFVHPTYVYIKPPDDEIQSEPPERDHQLIISMETFFEMPGLFLPLLICVSMTTNWTFFDVSLANFMSEAFNYSAADVGLAMLSLAAIYSLFCPLVGMILDKIGNQKTIMVLGCFIAAPAFVFIGPVPVLKLGHNIWLSMAALVTTYIACCLMYAPVIVVCLDMALARGFADNMKTRSFISQAFAHAGNFGNFLGPFLGGILTNYFGFEWTCIVYGFLTFACGLISAIYYACRWRNSRTSW